MRSERDMGGSPQAVNVAGPILSREVEGFIDEFVPPNILRGWALHHGHDRPLTIRVFAHDRLLGEGSTGRPRPTGNCGFSVTLSKPIELLDLFDSNVRAYAVADSGRLQPLQVWSKLFGPEWQRDHRANELRLGRDVERVIGDRVSEAARPYVSGGELL